jgi:lysophospholipase L1-like esterase
MEIRKSPSRSVWKELAVLAVLILGCAHQAIFAADGHWVTTWGCGPQLTEPGNLPPVPLANSTLRQFVRISTGGNFIRVRFSNAYGTDSVMINAAHVALAAGAGSAGTGNINPATDKTLTFRGAPGTVIPPGQVIYSDPVAFALPAITNLAVSLDLGYVSTTTINGHPGSRTTSFIVPTNAVAAASLPTASTTQHWYIITGVEVLAAGSSKAVIAFGDSITDGRGSTTDGNDRWPDDLAQRLNANASTTSVAVANMGIGGNGIFGGLGPAGNNRFDRDVTAQNGARWLIMFEGVNDIGGSSSLSTATNLIASYTQFADKAHSHNLLAYGATITPFGGNSYYSPLHEQERQTVNTWFRTNQVYDALIDFDAVARDPVTLTNLYAPYDSGDHLHLTPAGYQAMANAIDLNLFAH